MAYLNWFVSALLGFVGGWFLVFYLTADPIKIARALLLTAVPLFLLLWLAVSQFQGAALAGAAGVGIVGLLLGYAANTSRVLRRADDRYVPELTRAVGDPGDGHTGVIYFTHGEPETYDPIGWLNQFREFDNQGIAFVPFLARPFFLKRLRDAYLKVGSSQHRRRHFDMAVAVEKSLIAGGYNNVRVYPSFLDDDPGPDAALITALNDGASHIVVAEVFVSISNHTAEGKELMRAVDTEALGVPVSFAGPLWDSITLHQMFVDKVESERGSLPRGEVAVLLVGHGQPDEWDLEWPTETEHELGLREGIIAALVAVGYDRRLLDLAWMEFKEPKATERAGQLASSGAKKIIYFSAGISAESIHSQYDVPKLVAKARIDERVDVVNLGAWNNHPLTIRAISERVESLLTPSARASAGVTSDE